MKYCSLLLIIFGLLTSSCHHKDLCYHHDHTTTLDVVYQWDQAPEASPDGMCAFFYSVDRAGEFKRFDFIGAKESSVDLPAGEYKIITYNNDTEVVQFSSKESFDNHVAYTRTGDMLEPLYGNGVTSSLQGNDGERVVITPDSLYGCNATEITIADTRSGCSCPTSRAGGGEISTDINGNQTITLHPHDMLCHYSFEVRNVKNANKIERVSASISGMAGEMNLSDESLSTECVTLPLPAQANGSENSITGSFLTFGHNESNSAPHKMAFYIVMNNGSKYSVKDLSKLDVTDQVDSAADKRHVHIIIDGLDIPDDNEESEGFFPSVDDWGVVNEDLDL